MSLLINTNIAATNAALNLSTNNTALQKSLARLSSGSKIVSPADDAGGLAVSMRMSASIKRTDATNTNLGNAVSFLQTQDGALSTAGKILDRISELKTLASDVTKSTEDTANYDMEFKALQAQLTTISKSSFNGTAMFTTNDTADTLHFSATDTGSTNDASITIDSFASDIAKITAATGLRDDATTSFSITDLDAATSSIAAARAQNGAEQSNIGFAQDMLNTNKTNLEAANSRIVDVDVAQESTRMAKNNILVQASAAMLSQANQSAQVALKLLQG